MKELKAAMAEPGAPVADAASTPPVRGRGATGFIVAMVAVVALLVLLPVHTHPWIRLLLIQPGLLLNGMAQAVRGVRGLRSGRGHLRTEAYSDLASATGSVLFAVGLDGTNGILQLRHEYVVYTVYAVSLLFGFSATGLALWGRRREKPTSPSE